MFNDTNNKFKTYLKAGYPFLWIETHEEQRCMMELSAQTNGYNFYDWDLITGLQEWKTGRIKNIQDPMEAVSSQTLLEIDTASVIFLKDFHRFISSIEIIRAIKNASKILKENDIHIVFVGPVINIPVELEKEITVIEFSLPSVESLLEIGRKIVDDNGLNIPIDKAAIAAGKGLTFEEAENAIAYSIIVSGNISRQAIEDSKLQAIKKSGLMELHMPEPESNLGGLCPLKTYLRSRKKGFTDDRLPAPKGILLTGLPGSGKSLSAKVCASVFDFPLLKLDISALKGSLVGESERNMKRATQMIDAIGECVVWVDEVEKALGGVQSSNKTDGGTTSAMFGHLLTWMQETKSKSYIVATCNDMEDLLTISQGALLRRFDDIFFIDTPTETERTEIIRIMNQKYGADIDPGLASNMADWTGAEIEKYVKSSLFDGETVALANIKPIFQQNKDRLIAARQWAKHNCRMANHETPIEPGKAIRNNEHGKRKVMAA